MNKVFISTIAGAMATLPMTLVMTYLHKRLPSPHKEELAPRKIVKEFSDKIGITPTKNNQEIMTIATLHSHFAYGALAGAFFTPLLVKVPRKRVFLGMGLGSLVWAGSYLGWLPLTGFYKSAVKEPRKRNSLYIASHLVWGTFFALIFDAFERPKTLSGLTAS